MADGCGYRDATSSVRGLAARDAPAFSRLWILGSFPLYTFGHVGTGRRWARSRDCRRRLCPGSDLRVLHAASTLGSTVHGSRADPVCLGGGASKRLGGANRTVGLLAGGWYLHGVLDGTDCGAQR